jgi:hypothetical protein
MLPIGLFSWVEESHVSLQRKQSMLEAAVSSICFPVRIEFVFERNSYCKSEFSRWFKVHFVPNRPIQLK